MTEKTAMPRDHKLAKAAQTMSVNQSTASFKPNQVLTLHHVTASVIISDPTETFVQYSNGAQRLFRTNDLAGYMELGTFPSSSRFTRPVEGGLETAYVEHITTDSYIMVVIGKDGLDPNMLTTMTYAELMAWHMAGPKPPAERTLPGKLYLPKSQPKSPETLAYLEKAALEELAEMEAFAASETADDEQPFEADLKTRIIRLEADLAAIEVESQKSINALTTENFKLKQAIQQQVTTHATITAGYEEDLARLEAKAAILAPICKEYLVKQPCTESDLNKYAAEGWQIQHMQFVGGDFGGQLNVVLVRDLPTPAPKVARPAAEHHYIGAVPLGRQPVQRPPTVPPMPASHTVVSTGAPISRALTNNVPKHGDTRKVTVPSGDPVIQEALRAGQTVYNQRMQEGTAAINQAAQSFIKGA